MVIRKEFRRMVLPVVHMEVCSSVCVSDWTLSSLLPVLAETETVM